MIPEIASRAVVGHQPPPVSDSSPYVMDPPVCGPAPGADRGAACTLEAVSDVVSNATVSNPTNTPARRPRTREMTPRSIPVLLRTRRQVEYPGVRVRNRTIGRPLPLWSSVLCAESPLDDAEQRMRLFLRISPRRAVAMLVATACVVVFAATAANAASDKVPVTRSVY